MLGNSWEGLRGILRARWGKSELNLFPCYLELGELLAVARLPKAFICFWPVVGRIGVLFAVRIGSVGRLGRAVGVHVVSCCS